MRTTIKPTSSGDVISVVTAVCAAAPALLGLIVLLGWYTHNVTLIQVSPAFVPMQYNTALGFLAAGLGLAACWRGLSGAALGLGGLTAAIGGLTLAEYIFGIDLGIDQILMEHYITTETSHPGRMAPNTALCFTLTGLAVVIAVRPLPGLRRDPAIAVLGSLVFGLGFIAFSGYAMRLETAYGWGHLTRMAVHTSAGFIVLGIGLAAFARMNDRRASHPSNWLPLSAGIGLMTITVSLWQALSSAAAVGTAQVFVLVFGTVLSVSVAAMLHLLRAARASAAEKDAAVADLAQARDALEAAVAERTRELSDTEAELRVALDSMPGGFMMTDRDLNIRLVNDEFYKFSGLTPDVVKPGVSHETVIRYMAENGYMGELDDIDAAVAKRIETLKNPTDQVMPYTTPDGRTHEVRRRKTDDGHLISISMDVTERMAIQRAVEENEKNLRAMLDASPIGIGVIDQETNERLFANAQLVAMLGAETAEELTSARLEDSYVNPDDLETIRSAIADGGSAPAMEVLRRRRDGSTFWCLQSALPFGLFQGRDARVVWMVDIDEQKRTEEELARQKAIIDTALDNMAQGISMFDEDLNIVAFNDRYIDLLGFPGELAELGTHISAYFRYNAERGEYGEGDIEALVQERIDLALKFEAHQFQRQLSDGKTIEIKGQPVPTGGFVSTYTDITDIIEAERSAQLLQEALDTFSDMVILYDRNEKVIFTNDRYHEIYPNSPPKDEITNYTMEGLLRRSLETGQINHPLAKTDPEAWLAQALASRRDKDGGSGETTHANGRTYFFRYGWTSEGGMILVQFDITERKQVEEALKASEAQLRTILENSPVAVAISCDDQSEDDGIIEFCNPRFMEMVGMTADEIGTARTSDFYRQRENREVHERELDEGKSLFDMETIWSNRDGHEVWTLTSVSPIHYAERKSALIWIYDISELKETQREIAEQEARLRLALDNMPGAMWLVDKDMKLVFANDQYVGYYGDPEGLVKPGTPIANIVTHEAARGRLGGKGSLGDLIAARMESYEGKTTTAFEDTAEDGRTLQLMRRPTEDGYVISVATDISDRKEAERQVEAQRAQLDGILRNIQQGVVLYDKDQNLAAWNPHFPDILNLDVETLYPGRPMIEMIREIAARGDYGADEVETMAQRRLRELWSGDTRADLSFGGDRRFEVHSTTTPDGGLIVTYTDITERKRNEELIKGAMAAINESIQYASRIQRAVLPSQRALTRAFGSHFLIWEPKDVVGGDMVWLRQIDGGCLLIVADCTGHGAPGAFMTMIATGALDQAVREVPGGDPAQVIGHMNRVIKTALRQDRDDGESDDGLELAVCRIIGQTLTFAGARSSLHRLSGGEIEEIKGDKSGIGYRRVSMTQIFTDIDIDVADGDQFYIWTDGVTDQIGGPKRRSYGKRRVKASIMDYQKMTLGRQKAQIFREFTDYQHAEERRDDVTFIGFTVKG